MAGLEPFEQRTPPSPENGSGFSDRRKAARYVPLMDLGHLGWWDGLEFRSLTVRLLNLSLEGAAVLLNEPAPTEAAVWVSIVGLEWAGWASADVIGTLLTEEKTSIVRVLFLKPLPYEVFRISVWGFPDEHHSAAASTSPAMARVGKPVQ